MAMNKEVLDFNYILEFLLMVDEDSEEGNRFALSTNNTEIL